MVFIDRNCKGKNISGVFVDDKLGASMAVDHLIKLGHKRILVTCMVTKAVTMNIVMPDMRR